MFKFRIFTLLFVTGIVSLNMSAIPFGLFTNFLASILSISALVNYVSRFTWEQRQMVAGLKGVLAAMLWGGTVYGSISFYTTESWFAAFLACMLGAGIGFIVGIFPAVFFGMIPESKLNYTGDRDKRPDRVVTSISPYIHGG